MKATSIVHNNPVTDGLVTITMTEVEAKRLYSLVRSVGLVEGTVARAMQGEVTTTLRTDPTTALETLDMVNDLKVALLDGLFGAIK